MKKQFSAEFYDARGAKFELVKIADFKYEMAAGSFRIFFDDFGVSPDGDLIGYRALNIVFQLQLSQESFLKIKSLVLQHSTPSISVNI